VCHAPRNGFAKRKKEKETITENCEEGNKSQEMQKRETKASSLGTRERNMTIKET
jgi:hypothetical protein